MPAFTWREHLIRPIADSDLDLAGIPFPHSYHATASQILRPSS